MLRKAQQGSAGGSRDGWLLVAALLACLSIILVSAADAVAAVPSAAAIPSATQRAAAVVPAPIRETAGHAAALPAAGRPAAPSAGATSIAGHSAQLAAGDPTEAVKTATHVPSGVAAGAGGLPAVAKAVPAVEHTATRTGQLTKDLAAAAES